jgi:hypothetical protein
MLALAPDAHMSILTLKKLLFSPHLMQKLSLLQRLAMRILYESSEYRLPFARRAALQREMESKLTKIARERVQPVEKLEEELRHRGTERNQLLEEVVHQSIDAITYSRSEREIQKLQQENVRLREELAKAQADMRRPRGKKKPAS